MSKSLKNTFLFSVLLSIFLLFGATHAQTIGPAPAEELFGTGCFEGDQYEGEVYETYDEEGYTIQYVECTSSKDGSRYLVPIDMF